MRTFLCVLIFSFINAENLQAQARNSIYGGSRAQNSAQNIYGIRNQNLQRSYSVRGLRGNRILNNNYFGNNSTNTDSSQPKNKGNQNPQASWNKLWQEEMLRKRNSGNKFNQNQLADNSSLSSKEWESF